jgi:hypothetical protein
VSGSDTNLRPIAVLGLRRDDVAGETGLGSAASVGAHPTPQSKLVNNVPKPQPTESGCGWILWTATPPAAWEWRVSQENIAILTVNLSSTNRGKKRRSAGIRASGLYVRPPVRPSLSVKQTFSRPTSSRRTQSLLPRTVHRLEKPTHPAAGTLLAFDARKV